MFKHLCKNETMEWNDKCQEAFKKIKQYIKEPPVLVPPLSSKPFIMCLTILGVHGLYTGAT